MFIKTHMMVFISLMMTGTIITMSANSWMTAWIGLEINLMSAIPLMMLAPTMKFTESAIKYFIPQAMASLILILTTTMENTEMAMSNLFINSSNMIILSLAIKLGMAPFHFWFPQVMVMAEWNMCAILMIWQKIAPYVMMMYFTPSTLTLTLILLSGLVGALGGLNQPNLKMILTFSSISHSGWLLAGALSSFNTWMMYFLIYSVITIPLITFLDEFNALKINDLLSNQTNYFNKYLFMANMLSLGGLPPFLGFSAKLITLTMTLKSLPMMISISLIMTSLISLYYYSKLFFSLITLKAKTSKMQHPKLSTKMNKSLMASMVMNLSSPLMFLLT